MKAAPATTGPTDYKAKYEGFNNVQPTNNIEVDKVIDSVGEAAKDLYKGVKPKVKEVVDKAEPKVKETIKEADTKVAQAIVDSKDKVVDVSQAVKAKADEIMSSTSQKASAEQIADQIVKDIKEKSN